MAISLVVVEDFGVVHEGEESLGAVTLTYQYVKGKRPETESATAPDTDTHLPGTTCDRHSKHSCSVLDVVGRTCISTRPRPRACPLSCVLNNHELIAGWSVQLAPRDCLLTFWTAHDLDLATALTHPIKATPRTHDAPFLA